MPFTPFDNKENELIQRLQNQSGLMLAYQPGFGKGKKSIQVGEGLSLPSEVIVPAALKKNYEKEQVKWLGKIPENSEIKSQENIARHPELLSNNPNRLLIVDESQRMRNPATKLYSALQHANAKKRLLLSATPSYNDPSNLATQINFVANSQVLPTDKKEFNDRYVKSTNVNPGLFGRLMGVHPGVKRDLTNTDELSGILKKYVDYAEPNLADYPTSKKETIKVPLGVNQQELYDTLLNKANFWTRYKVRHNLPPTKSELKKMLPFLTGVRQSYLTNAPFTNDASKIEQPKIEQAAQYLKERIAENPRYKGVVYSNYLNAGLKPYGDILKQQNIPYGEFSGEVSNKQRNQALNDYNAGKLKALLVSGAGAQGLDTKGTRLVQMLEPSWNKSLEQQIEGRAIRNHSHAELPLEERNVLIQRYLAEPRATGFFGNKPVGADEYISNIAENKDRLNQQVYAILKRNAGIS